MFQRTLIWSAALLPATLLSVGCSSATPTPFDDAPASVAPYVTVDGKGDLPNDSVYHREHDRSGYREIAEQFAADGFDLTVERGALEARWPLLDEHTAVLNRQGTPIMFSYMGYLHSAFDIYRSDIHGDDTVVAPISGTARVFDWFGEPGYSRRPYDTVVAIWDPNSHLIVQVMHVEPTAELMESGELEVEAGQPIGRLAEDLTWLEGDDLQRYRHTHVNVIDGENMIALDPADTLPYVDNRPPKMLDAYLLDSDAVTTRDLRSGAFDVVLDVFDRDDADIGNLEVASIAFEIADDQGNVLLASERCRFADMIESLDFDAVDENDPSTMFIDYGSARWQTAHGGWGQTDFDYFNRSFRYALTQFRVGEDGACVPVPDEDGELVVPDEVEALHIRAQLWDPSGNRNEVEHVFRRGTSEDAGRLVINELLVAPPEDFDANSDGVFDARQDEFVEIVNSSEEAISLAGYKLRDDRFVRFEFPEGTVIEPGAAVVVFGGGEPNIRTRAETFTAGTLGLNDDGDWVALLDPDRNVVDRVFVGRRMIDGRSVTRSVDGDHHARFVRHPEAIATPGMKLNRELF